jgi:serine/threonine-protein kinase
MNSSNLRDIPEGDDLVLQIEQFKMGLVSRATGGDFENDEYRRLRKLVLSIPESDKLVPRFLKLCRTVDDFWGFIKGQSATYAERREFLSKEINPILEFVEYEVGEGSLEFKRNYEEIKVIGNGGYGLVYLYKHKLLALPFAVKIFAPVFHEGGEKELERFFQEARMLFSLNHPSIIRVYDAGLIGKRPFIRMEYFDGLNLNEILSKHGILTAEQSLVMIKSIVDGLHHAHEDVGIIHRDLKPSNIMASKPNLFKIIDFGLGIFIENELHSRLTTTGETVISGYYNAPELVENPKLIDKRSDIYSVGAIWFTMLTGQPPAGTSLISKLQEIVDLKSEYINCISKCLNSIDLRYNNCKELMSDLNNLGEKL